MFINYGTTFYKLVGKTPVQLRNGINDLRIRKI
jgi:hypothetical protein